jgi:PEP-CTERM motif
MSFLKNAMLLVGLSIAAVGLSGIANATPFGMSEIAKNHEFDAGAKNHGAVVSEAAKHHGGGNQQGALVSVNSQGNLSAAQSASSPQSVPEPGTLLLLGAGLLSLVVWHHRPRRGLVG